MDKKPVLPPAIAENPEHIRSSALKSGTYPFTPPSSESDGGAARQNPEHIRSLLKAKPLVCTKIRSMSVHFWSDFVSWGRENFNTKIHMAGKTIQMRDLKQAIILKKGGMSNRQIAKELGIDKETVNLKFAFIRDHGLSMDELLKLDDIELTKVFHGGHSAVTDPRHARFLELLDYFSEQLKLPHVTRQILWEEYRRDYPGGYGRSQFFFHLSQNLKVAKVTTMLTDTYKPGQILMIDFAGDTMVIEIENIKKHPNVSILEIILQFCFYHRNNLLIL